MLAGIQCDGELGRKSADSVPDPPCRLTSLDRPRAATILPGHRLERVDEGSNLFQLIGGTCTPAKA